MSTDIISDISVSEKGEYVFDPHIPDRIEKFFATFLVHSKGTQANKPFVLLDWQKEIINDLYGTYNRETKLRRYRNGLILIPRKNGKTTLCAGLCLYELIFGEESGEIIACANNREQAKVIFNAASDFISKSKILSKRVKVYKNSIYNPKNRSTFKVISREANTALGMNCSMVIFDELLGAPDDALYNSLVTSMGARKQPLMLSISTAGFSKASFLYQLVEHGERVNSGIIKDDTFYAKIYGLKDEDDWTKEETWKKCNPSLGHTISMDFFRTEFNRAKEFPRFELAFKTLYLNAWIDHEKSWIGDTQWMKCGKHIDMSEFKGLKCYAGLDLSSTTDLTALVLCFYKDDKYHLFAHAFCPEDGIKLRSRKDKVPYELWAQQKHLTPTDGNATDYEYVLKHLTDLSKDYNIESIAVDRWNSTYLTNKLMEAGFNVIAFGQGFSSMSSPTKAMERCVLNESIVHDNNPIFRWCMSNVILKMDPAGNIKPDKAKSRERIDIVVAALMALEECSKNNLSAGIGEVSWI